MGSAHPHLHLTWLAVILCVAAFFVSELSGQGNPAFINDPDDDSALANQFFLDSHSDCNGPVRELYGNKAKISAPNPTSTRVGPTSCTLTLKAEGQFEGFTLDINVVSMEIRDEETIVAIYDGEGAQSILMSYDSGSSYQQNRRNFQTSGAAATFIMTRQNPRQSNFNILIRVTPIRGGTEPGWENDYGRGNTFAFDKFPQEAIVGMIGGFYLLVLIVCIIVVILFFRHFKGLDKEWETHQLATIKTGSVFDARLTNQPSQAWSVAGQSQAGPASQYSRGAGTEVYSRKKMPPSEDGDSGVFYNEERFQTRRLMNEERNGARPKYATNNISYSEPEDDPDNFKEKVITPRVRTARNRNPRPPSYEEAVSENESRRSSEDESDSDNSIRKKSVSSESGRSRSSESQSESETGSESESESSSSDPESSRGARARRPKKKKHGGRHKGKKSKQRRDSDEKSGSSRTTASQPSQKQRQQPAPQQMPPMPYGVYPPPGQFVPVMAGPPPQFQPVAMMPGYPPPQYPEDRGGHSSDSSRNQVKPTDPPVYSYLVRRGYTPLDQRSNVTRDTREGRVEEPDSRLSTGVDYMRR